MRTYGRINGVWTLVQSGETDEPVWLTTLGQVLRLNLGESPFYANWGIPARVSVATQVFPGYYVARTQMLMSQYFPMLAITLAPGAQTPVYNVTVTLSDGSVTSAQVPV